MTGLYLLATQICQLAGESPGIQAITNGAGKQENMGHVLIIRGPRLKTQAYHLVLYTCTCYAIAAFLSTNTYKHPVPGTAR